MGNMKIEVYSDGSATSKGKPGGYGWVMVMDGDKHSEGSGHMDSASNNDAELEAAIQGLAAAYKFIMASRIANAVTSQVDFEVTLISDSQLILGWADGGYKCKQPDKQTGYQKLRGLVARMDAKTKWVRGHSGDTYNERCDQLANEARTGIKKRNKHQEALDAGETVIGIKKTGILCVWYLGQLKVIDLSANIVEDYSRDIHGPRGSMLEIREEKSR